MIQIIFYWIFNMSIVSAVTGIVLLPIRSVKRIPRRIVVFFWLIPFLRMVIPFGIGSRYSLMSLLSRFLVKNKISFGITDHLEITIANSIGAAESYFPLTYQTEGLEKIFSVASAVWSIVFLAIVLTLATLYFTTLRELRDARHLKEEVYLSEKITSPAVYGMTGAKIILPGSYAEKDLELILLHERVHIKRGDNRWRVAAFLVAAAHWFNPFAWIFLKLFLEDLELSCDECVLLELGGERAKDYALALLESRQSTNIFASAFGGAKIRTRVENILSFRKLTWFSAIVFLSLTAAIFYVLLTNVR